MQQNNPPRSRLQCYPGSSFVIGHGTLLDEGDEGLEEADIEAAKEKLPGKYGALTVRSKDEGLRPEQEQHSKYLKYKCCKVGGSGDQRGLPERPA